MENLTLEKIDDKSLILDYENRYFKDNNTKILDSKDYYIYLIKDNKKEIGIVNASVNDEEEITVINRLFLEGEYRTASNICFILKEFARLEAENENRKTAWNVFIPGDRPSFYKKLLGLGEVDFQEEITATEYSASLELLKECVEKFKGEISFFEDNKNYKIVDFPLDEKYINDLKQYFLNNESKEVWDLLPIVKKDEYEPNTSKAVLDLTNDKIVCYMHCQKDGDNTVIFRRFYTRPDYRDYKLFRAFMIYITGQIIENNYSVKFIVKSYNNKMDRFVKAFFRNKLNTVRFIGSELILN